MTNVTNLRNGDEQPTLIRFGFSSSNSRYGQKHPKQMAFQDSLLQDFIVQGNMPLNIVETGWFKRFIATIDEKLTCPRSYAIRSKISTLFDQKKKQLQAILSDAGWLSITLDLWSDRRMRSFMGITVHFLGADMKQRNYLLDMSQFDKSHTGDNIVDHCLSIIDTMGLRQKICFIVTDNASNMIKAFNNINDIFGDTSDIIPDTVGGIPGIVSSNSSTPSSSNNMSSENSLDAETSDLDEENEDYLQEMMPYTEITHNEIIDSIGRIKRISCGIHTLQLAILDALKEVKFMSQIQSKCSRLSTILHTSGKFSEEYFKVFRNTIPATTNTRWNSLYLQFAAVSKLDSVKLENLLKESNHKECIFTSREVKLLQEVTSVLEPAYDATIVMEEEKSLISLLAPTVSVLHKKWTEMLETVNFSHSLVNALLKSLESRFLGIFKNIGMKVSVPFDNNDLPFSDISYILAAALDPDFRLQWVDGIIRANYKGISVILKLLIRYHT